MPDAGHVVLGVVAGSSAWAATAPVLWYVCDARCARQRLRPAATDDQTAQSEVDPADFLEAVARGIRAGEPAARAIITAPPCSPGTVRIQRRLLDGASVQAALDHDGEEAALLRSAVHHGSVSAEALDHAATMHRRRRAVRTETEAAAAAALHSLRLLTFLPPGFLACALLVSPAMRTSARSPFLLLVITCGFAVNRAGARWIARIVTAASTASPGAELAETSCASVATHLRAGGSVETAVAVLARHHDAFVVASRMMTEGHSLDDSLAPVDSVCPPLRRVLVRAHRDGLPVVDAVTALATDIAVAAGNAARARIARVPVRATAPVVLCLLPSFVLSVVVPVAVAFLPGLPHSSIPT